LKAIESDSYLPVLALTAQPTHKLRALQAGAKDFVSKPFDLPEVLMRVHNLLEVRLLHEKARSYGKALEALALQDPLTGLPSEAVSRPYRIGSETVTIPASAGVSVHPSHGEYATSLMLSADVALYEAMRAG